MQQMLRVLLNGETSTAGDRVLNDDSVAQMLSVHYASDEVGCGFGVLITENAVAGRKLFYHTGNDTACTDAS